MKKFFAVILVFIVMMSFVACGETTPHEEEVVSNAKFEEMEFTILERDASSNKYGTDFYMLLDNDKYTVFIETNVKLHVDFCNVDTIKVQFKPEKKTLSQWCTGYVRYEDFEFYAEYVKIK